MLVVLTIAAGGSLKCYELLQALHLNCQLCRGNRSKDAHVSLVKDPTAVSTSGLGHFKYLALLARRPDLKAAA